jgi:hypothetical protein
MVNDLEKWTDQSMLNLLAEGKIGTGKPTEDIKLFNDLALFKKNITEFMDTLHKMD